MAFFGLLRPFSRHARDYTLSHGQTAYEPHSHGHRAAQASICAQRARESAAGHSHWAACAAGVEVGLDIVAWMLSPLDKILIPAAATLSRMVPQPLETCRSKHSTAALHRGGQARRHRIDSNLRARRGR